MELAPAADRKSSVQSVERAFNILEALAQAGEPARFTDIAAQLGLNAHTTHNLIRTLFQRGYVCQLADGRYTLGNECRRLGAACNIWDSLRDALQPLMLELTTETGYGAFLAANENGRLICVAVTEGQALRLPTRQLWLDKWHCTATGKAILAFDSSALWERLRREGQLEAFGPRTITDWDELAREIELTRQRGYGFCRSEAQLPVAALAVPIFDGRERLVAALGQTFPESGLDNGQVVVEERVERLRRFAREAAAALSARPAI